MSNNSYAAVRDVSCGIADEGILQGTNFDINTYSHKKY